MQDSQRAGPSTAPERMYGDAAPSRTGKQARHPQATIHSALAPRKRENTTLPQPGVQKALRPDFLPSQERIADWPKCEMVTILETKQPTHKQAPVAQSG